MTAAVFTESAAPSSHYYDWLKIPSGRWLSLQEVRVALGGASVTDTADVTPEELDRRLRAVDQRADYLEQLGYVRVSRTVEERPNPHAKPWDQNRVLRVIVPRYRREQLHLVEYEAQVWAATEEARRFAREGRAASNAALDQRLRELGLIPGDTTNETPTEE
jgi:hypothetical protein